MKQVGVYEAKTHLARLLDEVERGERVTITRHGRPVAELVPFSERPKRSVDEVIDAIREHRRGNRLDGLSIKEMIEEGRL